MPSSSPKHIPLDPTRPLSKAIQFLKKADDLVETFQGAKRQNDLGEALKLSKRAEENLRAAVIQLYMVTAKIHQVRGDPEKCFHALAKALLTANPQENKDMSESRNGTLTSRLETAAKRIYRTGETNQENADHLRKCVYCRRALAFLEP